MMEVKDVISWLKRNFITYNATVDSIIALLKSLEAENKKLKKENEAYKGMWKQLRKTLLSWGTPVLVAVTNTMERLEEEYLGGGE